MHIHLSSNWRSNRAPWPHMIQFTSKHRSNESHVDAAGSNLALLCISPAHIVVAHPVKLTTCEKKQNSSTSSYMRAASSFSTTLMAAAAGMRSTCCKFVTMHRRSFRANAFADFGHSHLRIGCSALCMHRRAKLERLRSSQTSLQQSSLCKLACKAMRSDSDWQITSNGAHTQAAHTNLRDALCKFLL